MATQRQDKAFSETMEGHIEPIKIDGSALDDAVSFIASELEPDDVFTNKQLEVWAISNGFVKENLEI